MSASVLVIEDDHDIAEIVRHSLTAKGMECRVATTARDGMDAATEVRPDAIVLDVGLPDASGLELLPRLREIAPVIVLTGYGSDDAIVSGFESGADDWVTKPFSPRVLVARVEAAVRRRPVDGLAVSRIERGALVIDLERREATIADRALELTRRELDLLAYLAESEGRVVGREELLKAVWHSSAEWQGQATVTEHVRRLRAKLGDPRWIENVRGVGYRFTIVV